MDYLNENDIDFFMEHYQQFLLFIGEKYNLMSDEEKIKKQKGDASVLLIYLRDKVFIENKSKLIDYLNLYIEEYKKNLNDSEIEILKNWKNGFEGNFFIISYSKNYTSFLEVDKNIPYGVLGITQSIKNILPPNIIIKTLLLPFRDKIISDGLFQSQNMHFGGSIVRGFKEDFQKAKTKYGKIITNLNEEIEIQSKEKGEISMLEYYLGSEKRMREYWNEICDLWRNSEKHKITFYLARGKLYSKIVKKRYKEFKINGLYVAILEDVVVASAKTQKELDKLLSKILDNDKLEYIYTFKIPKIKE